MNDWRNHVWKEHITGFQNSQQCCNTRSMETIETEQGKQMKSIVSWFLLNTGSTHWEGKVVSTDDEENWLLVCWRVTLDCCSSPFTKIDLTRVEVSDMWLWTVKLLKETVEMLMAQVWWRVLRMHVRKCGSQSQKWTSGIYPTKNVLHGQTRSQQKEENISRTQEKARKGVIFWGMNRQAM